MKRAGLFLASLISPPTKCGHLPDRKIRQRKFFAALHPGILHEELMLHPHVEEQVASLLAATAAN